MLRYARSHVHWVTSSASAVDRTIEHFQGTASVKTWLGAIVRNAAIDHQRAARRRMERYIVQDPEGMLRECVSALPSPEDLVLLNERRAYVARSVETLSPRLRKALRLWCSGMYTYDEMAHIARIATGTMKSRVWEARREVMRMFPLTA